MLIKLFMISMSSTVHSKLGSNQTVWLQRPESVSHQSPNSPHLQYVGSGRLKEGGVWRKGPGQSELVLHQHTEESLRQSLGVRRWAGNTRPQQNLSTRWRWEVWHFSTFTCRLQILVQRGQKSSLRTEPETCVRLKTGQKEPQRNVRSLREYKVSQGRLLPSGLIKGKN